MKKSLTQLSLKGKQSSFRSFITALRKKRIIEILAAFIGGGWLILEFVHWILIDHFHFPEQSLDITIITLICALICILIWRLFSGVEKKPRKIKMEFIIIPLVILITAFFDIRFIQQIGEAEEAAISTPEWKNSIAVLPFANISPEEGQEYFCDGLTEELINRLSNIRELKVPARSSVFAFKGEKIDISEVGQKLKVDKVLEGSVRKSGNLIRVTAQLINVADGYHLWSEKYDRKIKDVFAIQDEISLAIIDSLKIKLLGKEKAKLVKRHTQNLEAYNLYLKGRFFWNKRTGESMRKGMEYFQQAIENDPTYALAYVGLADAFNQSGTYSFLPPKDVYPKAKAAVRKALEIDDTLGEAYASLGWISTGYDWDWLAAERAFKRAIELNPGYPTAHLWYSNYLGAMGRLGEAITEVKRAQELDPLSLIINACVGLTFHWARQYDEAIEQFRKTIEMDPNFLQAQIWLGDTYCQKEMWEEAIIEIQKAVSIAGDMPYALGYLGSEYALSGQTDEALKMLNRLNELSKEKYVSPLYKAWIYLGLGEKDQEFEYLEKAYLARDPSLIFINVSTWYDKLRSDPRFNALLKKMGLE